MDIKSLDIKKRNDIPIRKREKAMATAKVKAVFACDVKKVWDIVTDLKEYSWRSDIERIEILSGSRFVEYTKDGYATTFTITAKEPLKRWEFDLENTNMRGHWTGIFSWQENGTAIEFTEEVAVKKFFLKPFARMYLKKQQAAYIADLRQACRDGGDF